MSVADTTGAGDAFCAGFIRGDPAPKFLGAGETNSSGERNTPLLAAGYFIRGIINGFNLDRCVSVGNAAAGLNISRIGATGGAVDWHFLQKFMETYDSTLYIV